MSSSSNNIWDICDIDLHEVEYIQHIKNNTCNENIFARVEKQNALERDNSGYSNNGGQ